MLVVLLCNILILDEGAGARFLNLTPHENVHRVAPFIRELSLKQTDFILQLRLHSLVLQGLLKEKVTLICKFELILFDLEQMVVQHRRVKLPQGVQIVQLEVHRIPTRHLLVMLALLKIVKQRVQCSTLVLVAVIRS